jgi:purine-binding chemotaxis protein CheW
VSAVSDVHVRLRIGRETYAVAIENVLEVAELGNLATVPGAAIGVLGVRNFNGQVLPVFDLAHILGVPLEGRPQRLVVTEQGGRLAGFAVDDVTTVAPLEGALQETDVDCLAHATIEDGQLVGVVDLACVFAALIQEAA